jgi:hypothetical protein
VEDPDNSHQYEGGFFSPSGATYSVNLPMWVNTFGGNSAPVSELMWTIRIAFSNSWVCSNNWVQSFLFCLIVCHVDWDSWLWQIQW